MRRADAAATTPVSAPGIVGSLRLQRNPIATYRVAAGFGHLEEALQDTAVAFDDAPRRCVDLIAHQQDTPQSERTRALERQSQRVIAIAAPAQRRPDLVANVTTDAT